jgi:sec-independent protein translocase protein TatB
MFDIGWGELVLIGIVALIAIGPKELPTVLRTVGQYMGKIKRMAAEFQGQFQEAMREAEMADLKKQADDLTSAVTDATNFDPLADIDNDGDGASSAAEPANTETDTETKSDAETEPEKTEAEPEQVDSSAETSAASQVSAEPEASPGSDLPPPEPPAPVSEKEFVPAEPAPKQAGGKA